MIDCIKEWQTLIAGLLALISAVATIITLIWNHSSDKKRHIEEKEKAAEKEERITRYTRSLLLNAAGTLYGYSKKCFAYVDNKEENLPKKPDEAIAILQENIKYSDSVTSKNIFDIVSFYQKHNARLEGYKENTSVNKKEHIFHDVIILLYYFSSLYPYARDEKKSIENLFPNIEDIKKIFINVVGLDQFLDDFHQGPKKYEKIFIQIEKRLEHEKNKNEESGPKAKT